tara:strand:+ start:958 stop:1983 length:1026 start_codon:yes stop_codon:yes gene_type:complete
MVVFYHYSSEIIPDVIYNNFIIRQSWSFVDFFFVLSGFVIVYNYKNLCNVNDFYTYIKKRFIRLYPLLLFSTLVFLIFLVVSNTYLQDYMNNEKDIKSMFIDTCNTLLLLNSTSIIDGGVGMNYPSWSVSSEFICYLFFGISSLFFIRKKQFISLLIITGCIILNILNIESNTIKIGNLGFLRGLIGFNIGVLIYYLSNIKFNICNKIEYLVPVLILIYFYFFHTFEFENKSMIDFIFRPIMFGLTILILIKTNDYISKFLDAKPLKFLGKISYSVYLNHAILIIVIPKIIFDILAFTQNIFTEIFVFVVCLFFTVLYSYFTYKYIEFGFGKFLNKIIIKK